MTTFAHLIRRRLYLFTLALLHLACAHQAAVARPEVTAPPTREAIVEGARSLLGRTAIEIGGIRYPDDCTGLVRGLYAAIGIDLLSAARPGDNGVTAIHRYAKANGHLFHQEIPEPGDLVFFQDTYDRNRDGKRNDGLTHVGIVEEAQPDGTLRIIHRVRRGVVRYRMSLTHPNLHRAKATGAVLNDYLRARSKGEPPLLTGQLFAEFGRLLPDPPKTVAQR